MAGSAPMIWPVLSVGAADAVQRVGLLSTQPKVPLLHITFWPPGQAIEIGVPGMQPSASAPIAAAVKARVMEVNFIITKVWLVVCCGGKY